MINLTSFFFFFGCAVRIFADHDRPLSKTGKADAIKVAHNLHELGWIPQLILSRLDYSENYYAIYHRNGT